MHETPVLGQAAPVDQKEQARKFRKRLHSGDTFIMPEVWDVASARVLADAGFGIVGTSATAIAWSQGCKSGERLALDDLLRVASRITRGFGVPVNADLEGALDRSADEIKQAVAKALEAGCVGVTIGDGGRNGAHGILPMEDMADCLKAAKSAALEARIPAVIIASTEAFLLGARGQSSFETSVERAEAYFAAGADCILAPGVQHIQIAERLAGVIDGPLAVSIGLIPAPDLKSFSKAGVACVTLGASLMRSLLGTMRLKAEELMTFGHFNHLDRAIPADELEALLR